MQLALGFHDQPGAAQHGVCHHHANAAEQREGLQPVQRPARKGAPGHLDAVDVCAQRNALEERRHQRAADKRLVPDVALAVIGLEAELERHAAKDQPQQHEDQRQVERAEHHRVGQRKRGQQASAAQHQPGLVAVPHGGHRVHHHVAVMTVRHEGIQHADAQVETVHHHVHHHAKEDDDGPDQREVDAHDDQLLLSARRLAEATAFGTSPGSSTADNGLAGVPSTAWPPSGSGSPSCSTGPLRTSRIM